jgi:hypothetical protein
MYRRTRYHNPGDFNFYEKLFSVFILAILWMAGKQAVQLAVNRPTAEVE